MANLNYKFVYYLCITCVLPLVSSRVLTIP